MLQHGRVGEIVVQNDICPLKTLDRAPRDQAGIAGTRSHEVDFTRSAARRSGHAFGRLQCGRQTRTVVTTVFTRNRPRSVPIRSSSLPYYPTPPANSQVTVAADMPDESVSSMVLSSTLAIFEDMELVLMRDGSLHHTAGVNDKS